MPAAKDTISPSDKRRSPGRRRSDGGGRGGPESSAPAAGAVTFRVRRLEPLVAWVLAGFTLWLNIVFNATGLEVWLIAFFAACIGGWSRMFPARQQSMLFLRAALLLAGTLLLQITAGAGAAIGPYILLPAVITVFYAILLSTAWTVLLLLLTLITFGAACWLTLSSVPWQAMLVYAGFLVLVPPLAMEFGRALRQGDDSTESTLKDDRSQLYNEAGFFVHGAVLLAECHQRGRPFCMVLLNGADLLDVPGLLGRKVANELFAQVVRGIAGVSGEGIAARTDSVEFGLLLPGVTADRAAALVKQRLGDPPQVELQVASKDRPGAKPIVIVLDMAIAQATDKFKSIEELYDDVHAHWVVSKETGKAVAKVPLLGPDDDRTGPRRVVTSPTVLMALQANGRP
ncbi:MAG: hypothetical protein V4858_18795 [Pseudomonadota bacterium]